MKNAFLLARKDTASYFQSWVGVFLLLFFFLVAGFFFSFLIINYAKISLDAARSAAPDLRGIGLTRFVFSSFFLNLGAVLIFLAPLLSMKAFAEERRHGTLELLYTYPLTDFEIIWGKFLSMVWFFEILLLPTLSYAFFIAWIGGRLDWAPIAMGYLGFWLLGNAYLSLGLFISSVSENEVVSAIITFGLLILFWILDWATGIADGGLAHFLSVLSPLGHFREFAFGIFDLSNFAYFNFFTLYFLFLSLRSIEARHWKG